MEAEIEQLTAERDELAGKCKDQSFEIDSLFACEKTAIKERDQLRSQLAVCREALEKWLAFEDRSIAKHGQYVGMEIQDLIKNAREALKQLTDEKK